MKGCIRCHGPTDHKGNCERCDRKIKEKYGLGDRHVMREKNRELTEAWLLLNVLCLNMMDDGPTWPRVLEWLRRNEEFRPENVQDQTAASNQQPKA